MTKFTPGDRTIWWDNSRAVELAKDYRLLFATSSTYEAYLFAFMCKSDGIATLLGSATTEQEALDLIEESNHQNILCLLSDNIAADCGAKIALAAKDYSPNSHTFLIINDAEKYHSLSNSDSLPYSALCSSITVGRGGIYQCLQAVLADGNTYVDPVLKQTFAELDEKGSATLNSRERDVLSFVAQGLSNKEIAQQIYIAERTVRDYVSSILHKLDVANRAGAAAWAIRHGIVGG